MKISEAKDLISKAMKIKPSVTIKDGGFLSVELSYELDEYSFVAFAQLDEEEDYRVVYDEYTLHFEDGTQRTIKAWEEKEIFSGNLSIDFIKYI